MLERREAVAEYSRLELREFGEGDEIDLGALVELETKDGRTLYFLGPRAGGTEVDFDQREVWVITPQSPLGQQLFGRKQGDRIDGQSGPGRIVSVA